MKRDGELLRGRLALLWTGAPHNTPGVVDQRRDFARIVRAGEVARAAVLSDVRPLRVGAAGR